MTRKRLLFFVQDGAGLGHLSRICRIASFLQDSFTILIVTAKREACWMVPEHCEYIHLPSWKSVRRKTAERYNIPIWLDVETHVSLQMISDFYISINEIFKPDFIIVDYLPYGKFGEFRALLDVSNAKKYLIIRGIIDTSDNKIFCNDASEVYGNIYDKILIASDPSIIDFAQEYFFTKKFISKIYTIGYITPQKYSKILIREKYNIPVNLKWVVCSAGGGRDAEPILSRCLELSKLFPNCFFDVIFGPYTNYDVSKTFLKSINCRIHRNVDNLSEFLACSDVSIINGGYNSLVEAISGTSNIIVYPNQIGDDDEQINHSSRLSKYFPIRLLNNIEDLKELIEISLLNQRSLSGLTSPLMINGQYKIKEILELES